MAERIARHVRFLICGDCFWCASYFAGSVTGCLSCGSKMIDDMPVATNERYTFD